jgi:hypothetical protein
VFYCHVCSVANISLLSIKIVVAVAP